VKIVYLGLGSNIGDREQTLRSAIEKLQSAGLDVKRVSSVYETEAMYVREQRAFLNLVIEAETELFPMMLLSRVHKVELALGRKRGGAPNGPRTIDIDILFYGSFTVRSGKLEIPHPRLHERRFVLAPMAELAPAFRHPQLHKTMRELLATVEDQKVRKLEISFPIVRDPA
jgi:2-amino-4-hydroxy-6-hydroxymethyldihydropteridine diphosphokinase